MLDLPIKLQMVTAPRGLLLDRQIPDSAKLLWLILSARYASAQLIASNLALLSAPMVSRGLELLQRAGWLPALPRIDQGGSALMPLDLLIDQRLTTRVKLLYGALQLLPGFAGRHGQFVPADLCWLTGTCPDTVRGAVRALTAYNWLQTTQERKYSPISFTLQNPLAQKRSAELADVQERVERSEHKGEVIMCEMLSLVVDSDEYEDHARPVWLVFPLTGERMELDRHYYTHRVGWEFNGAQHDGPTERFPSESMARMQRTRDLAKAALCNERKEEVRLLVVRGKELSIEAIRSMAEGLLPLRDLSGHELLISYLDQAGRGWRYGAEKGLRSGQRGSGEVS